MRNQPNFIVFLFACLIIVVCGSSAVCSSETAQNARIHIPEAKLSLAVPDGWYRMPRESWYIERGFSAAFQKGEGPSITSSYLLVQVESQEKWPETKLKSIATSLPQIINPEELISYISSGKHKSAPELYNSVLDMHITIKEYADGGGHTTSVMAKRFLEHRYVVLHFYFRDALKTDVDVLAFVLQSLSFDEDEQNRKINAPHSFGQLSSRDVYDPISTQHRLADEWITFEHPSRVFTIATPPEWGELKQFQKFEDYPGVFSLSLTKSTEFTVSIVQNLALPEELPADMMKSIFPQGTPMNKLQRSSGKGWNSMRQDYRGVNLGEEWVCFAAFYGVSSDIIIVTLGGSEKTVNDNRSRFEKALSSIALNRERAIRNN